MTYEIYSSINGGEYGLLTTTTETSSKIETVTTEDVNSVNFKVIANDGNSFPNSRSAEVYSSNLVVEHNNQPTEVGNLRLDTGGKPAYVDRKSVV